MGTTWKGFVFFPYVFTPGRGWSVLVLLVCFGLCVHESVSAQKMKHVSSKVSLLAHSPWDWMRSWRNNLANVEPLEKPESHLHSFRGRLSMSLGVTTLSKGLRDHGQKKMDGSSFAISLGARSDRVDTIATRVEAISTRVKTIATRVETIATRVEAIFGWRLSLLKYWVQSYHSRH